MRECPGKVAILAVLYDLDPSYSVAGMVAAQLKLLVRRGHEVVFVTTDDFHDYKHLPAGVELRTYPRFSGKVPPAGDLCDFDGYRFYAGRCLAKLLADCPTCITHDTIFIHEYLPVNWAIRRANEELCHIHWLHWIHSAPCARPSTIAYPAFGRFSGMSNSEMVYVNRTDIPKVAEMFAVPETQIRTVYNFVDPFTAIDMHPVAEEIMLSIRYWEADVICVYPMRTDGAKQADKLIELLAAVKEIGNSVRVIICNMNANANSEKQYVGYLRALGGRLGLSEEELIITSQFQSSWATDNGYTLECGLPRRAVSDLMQLADLFVLPSVSEGCSIVMLEAALNKNCMVLNADLHSLQEFGGSAASSSCSDRALYIPFGNSTQSSSALPKRSFYITKAQELCSFQDCDRSLQFFKHVRKHHSPDWIYEHQLRPLLEHP